MKVFIGYDPRQPIAFQVLAHSIWKRASKPVEIIRLQLNQLPIQRRGLTEFTYSRFLVPYLCGYKGEAVFMDADMLCLGDIHELTREQLAAVSVVKNKMRFEWPSMMVFLNSACRILTPEYVDNAANSCFKFEWASGVGEVDSAWNHLVGYDEPRPDAKLVHFTKGVPVWPETQNCEYADEWKKDAKESFSSVPWADLMGNSVHAATMKAAA